MAAFDPPPTSVGDRTVVPVDVRTVEASIVFHPGTHQARVSARVGFTMGPLPGCPALDLRQPIDVVVLDGDALPPEAFGHQDLGGGEGAEMRVLDRALTAGSRHRLDLEYQLGTPGAEGAQPIRWDDETGAVSFDLWMSDLHPGRYLEMWLPANLCHDRFRLDLEIVVDGPAPQMLLSNGAVDEIARNRWRIRYPAHFTSLSPMLVIEPAAQMTVRQRALRLPGRRQPLTMVTAGSSAAWSELAACEADIASWLTANAERYGPWAHGTRFTAFIWGASRGMEYDGATTASVAALEHETFHSWFGRGIKPARARDGWIDEAWTSWATSNRRLEEGRFAEIDLGLDQEPVLLCPPNPWSRYTPTSSYREGARFFAGMAHQLGGPPRLRQAMAEWYQHNRGELVTTDGLERHLTEWSGVDVGPWFKRYVHGEG
jgi:hypothetical protein